MKQLIKMLGQANPDNTSNATLYTKVQDAVVRIDSLYITNVTGVGATARVFVDDDGTTGDTTTALLYDDTIDANTTVTLITKDAPVYLYTAGGSLIVQTGTGDALTFTAFGEEIFQ